MAGGAFGSVAVLDLDYGKLIRTAVKRVVVSSPTDADLSSRNIVCQVSCRCEGLLLPTDETLAASTQAYQREKALFAAVRAHPNILTCWDTFVCDGIGYFLFEPVRFASPPVVALWSVLTVSAKLSLVPHSFARA